MLSQNLPEPSEKSCLSPTLGLTAPKQLWEGGVSQSLRNLVKMQELGLYNQRF